MLSDYVSGTQDVQALASLVERAETWLRANGFSLADAMPEQAMLDRLREGWLSGTPLRTLCGTDGKAHKACRDFYGFTLTWLIHAASQQFRAIEDEDRAHLYGQIALFVELGLPNEMACLVFQAGIQSRSAAVELAALDLPFSSASSVAWGLRDPDTVAELRPRISAETAEWLDLLRRSSYVPERPAPSFRPFTLPGVSTDENLFVRESGATLRLSTVDGRVHRAVASTPDLPFDEIANSSRFCFRFEDRAWRRLVIRDPRARPAPVVHTP